MCSKFPITIDYRCADGKTTDEKEKKPGFRLVVRQFTRQCLRKKINEHALKFETCVFFEVILQVCQKNLAKPKVCPYMLQVTRDTWDG